LNKILCEEPCFQRLSYWESPPLILIFIEEKVVVSRVIGPDVLDALVHLDVVLKFLQIVNYFNGGAGANKIGLFAIVRSGSFKIGGVKAAASGILFIRTKEDTRNRCQLPDNNTLAVNSLQSEARHLVSDVLQRIGFLPFWQ
jgi:hypothetical protein